MDPRAIVLVEGTSDQVALETLAERRGRDLEAEQVAIVPIGGAQAIGRFLERFGPRARRQAGGLCDAAEERDFRRGSSEPASAPSSPAPNGTLGFYVCVADLEDELIRALGAEPPWSRSSTLRATSERSARSRSSPRGGDDRARSSFAASWAAAAVERSGTRACSSMRSISPRCPGRLTGCLPTSDDGYFDERVAAQVRRVLRGDVRPGGRRPGRRLPRRARRGADARSSSGSGRAGSRYRSRSAGVPVHGIELSKAMAARLRAKPGGEDIGVTIGDFATTTVEGTFSARLPGLQHDLEPDDAGGAGRVLPQRRGAPRARRLLRHRGGRPGAPAAPARRDHPRLPRQRHSMGHRRVRRRDARPHVAPLRDRRRKGRAPLDSVPLRVARRSST